MLLQQDPLMPYEVLGRLIRLNQSYKVDSQHSVNLGRQNFNLLNHINSVDFKQNWGDQESSFDIQLSFTWLDWYISDLVIRDDTFNLENIDVEQ